jgi:hypothetical protein
MRLFPDLRRGVRRGGKSSRSGTTTGGLLLWAGTTSIGVSTVIILAVLSRHHQGFSGLSTLFSLFFLASLIPAGVPLRAAALAVDGAQPPRLTALHLGALMLAGIVVSPLIAYVLHLPVLAVGFVAAQVIVAIQLAIRRGPLIAAKRFSALGANLFLEAATRVVLCIAAGLVWGLTGLSAGLLAGTAVALVTMPRHSSLTSEVTQRPMTTMFHTWIALALLGLFVQLDILLAPTGLSKEAATQYDLAAVPSKGVYLVLVAASTFIFPYVRVRAQRKAVLAAALATLGLGVLVTAVLVPLRTTIGHILGQHPATPFLLITLGVAMAIGGATGIIINGGVALGLARLWPPLLPGILALVAVWATRPSANVFATVFLAAQAGTLVIATWFCLRRRRNVTWPTPAAPSPEDLWPQPGVLGT